MKSETADLRELCTVLQTRCEALSDIPEQVDFIDALPDYDIELYTSKKMKTTPETAREALTAVLPSWRACRSGTPRRSMPPSLRR